MEHPAQQQSASPPRIGSREAQRWRLEVMIDARDGQNRTNALVLDVSTTGMRIRTLSPLRLGQAFWVRLPGIEAHMITVKWNEGFVSGCSFTEPLAECVLKHLLHTARQNEAEGAPIDRRTAPRA